MGTRRQKIQGKLAFTVKKRGEAPTLTDEGTEVSVAKRTPERPAPTKQLNQPNRRVRTRMHGGVTGKAREGLPMSIVLKLG
jgi:hypothetical protein